MPPGEACRCCGGAAGTTPIGALAGTDTAERFTLLRCDACGVLRTTPVPADLAPYYATDLAATMTHPGSLLFSALRRRQLGRELRRITRHGDPGTVVDVGCGVGDFVRVIAEHGVDAIAADAGGAPPAALARAPGIPYRQFDFDRYELRNTAPARPWTAVLRHVLEHVRDPYACLVALRRQGARQLYLVVPNAGCAERRLLGTYWYLWDPPRHLWHFDRGALERVCRHAGFAPLAVGRGTAPTLVPALYRYLRLHGWPRSLYARCGPTSLLTAAAAPLNLLLPGNVLWVVARADRA